MNSMEHHAQRMNINDFINKINNTFFLYLYPIIVLGICAYIHKIT